MQTITALLIVIVCLLAYLADISQKRYLLELRREKLKEAELEERIQILRAEDEIRNFLREANQSQGSLPQG